MLKHAALLLMDSHRWGTQCDRDSVADDICFEERKNSLHSGTFALMNQVGQMAFTATISIGYKCYRPQYRLIHNRDAFADGRKTFRSRLIVKKQFSVKCTLWPKVNPKLNRSSETESKTLQPALQQNMPSIWR